MDLEASWQEFNDKNIKCANLGLDSSALRCCEPKRVQGRHKSFSGSSSVKRLPLEKSGVCMGMVISCP